MMESEDDLEFSGVELGRDGVEVCGVEAMEDGDYQLDDLVIPGEVYRRLYGYQREGVEWLWKLRSAMCPSKFSGGVLGDDMGLGKTIQITAFVSALFHSGLVSRVLIVLPLSVLNHWSRTLTDWCPDVTHRTYHGSVADRERVMREVRMLRRPGIVLSTYGTVRTNVEELADCGGHWDYVILDEGHKIKTHTTSIAKAVRRIPSFHRILVTGTPLQNNLRELWSLFDFAVHGQLFGDLRTFIEVFENPILMAHERDASDYQKEKGAEAAEDLRQKIKPHFIRRQKSDTLDEMTTTTTTVTPRRKEHKVETVTPGRAVKMACLPKKKDLIVWIKLSDTQVTRLRHGKHKKWVEITLQM